MFGIFFILFVGWLIMLAVGILGGALGYPASAGLALILLVITILVKVIPRAN